MAVIVSRFRQPHIQTSYQLPLDLVERARELKINRSEVVRNALAQAIKEAEAEQQARAPPIPHKEAPDPTLLRGDGT